MLIRDQITRNFILDHGLNHLIQWSFLIKGFHPDKIANKVELLNDDRKLLLKMGKAARKKYEDKYTLEIFEKNMKEVFDKVLQEVNGEKNV